MADADTFLVTGDFCYSYLPFLIICRLLGKRVYGWGHGPKMGRGKTWIFYYWILKLMTGYFAYGENNRKRMIEIGFDPDRIYPIYNSLGEGVPEKIRKGLKSDVLTAHFGNEDPTILFIGRLTPQKDLGKLVEMAGRHRKEGLNYNLLFIGDGPEKAKLVGMAEKLGVSQYVWFYGACYDDDVMGSLIYNCDLCVAPGNVGLTALHAMTYGVPVGSHSDFETQMPEYETIVDSETGFLFRKDDWNDLADKIQKWLAAKSSPEKREETRQACFRMIDSKWNSLNQIEILKKVLAGG